MDDIRRSDSFIDALAGGRPVMAQDASDAELAALLGVWREETRWPPATGLITEADAITALNAGLNEKRGGFRERRSAPANVTPINSRRNHRGLSAIGAAAAAVLCIGGFGAVVAGAGPDDALYGLRTMLFGAPKQVRDDQVALAAKTELNQVQDLITQGNWEQAQDKLVAVSTQVASIGDEQQKAELLDQFNDLSAKVVERDPAATAPPGIIYTVPPSAAELVPAVAPPTSPTSVPSASDSTTPSTSTSASTSASESATSGTTTPTSGTPTSGTPTSGSESSSASSTAPSTSASEQSQSATTSAA
ncbi:MAG: anti-sigma-D factor RsdA, partial [Mycobacterium sp.]